MSNYYVFEYKVILMNRIIDYLRTTNIKSGVSNTFLKSFILYHTFMSSNKLRYYTDYVNDMSVP